MGNICTNNFERLDASVAEHEMRPAADPLSLLPSDEYVLLAYQLRYHRLIFTPRRIMLQDPHRSCCCGEPSNNKWFSLPYESVGAYSVVTPGSIDWDCEVFLYTKCHAPYVRLLAKDFRVDSDPLPVFEIQNLLNHYVLPAVDPFGVFDPGHWVGEFRPEKGENAQKQGFRDWLGDNAALQDPKKVQEALADLLRGDSETVVFAYKSGRDYTVFTNKRLLIVDVKGITGSRVSYTTLLYERVRLFAVETAGEGGLFTDRDSEFWLFTDLPSFPMVKQDLKRDCNVMQVQKFLTDVVCGKGKGMKTTIKNLGVDLGGGTQSTLSRLFGGEGDAGQIDAKAVDKEFHDLGVLQPEEQVEMGFKGRKDFMLLTTKRILFVDNKKKGFFGSHGNATNYLTIPYHSISHFAVQTPGGRDLFFRRDKDCELQIWTDSCCFIHEQPIKDKDGNVTGYIPPFPYVSMIEQDISRDRVDFIGLHQYLSEKLLHRGVERWSPPNFARNPHLPASAYNPDGSYATKIKRPELTKSNSKWELFWSWVTDDAQQVNPQTANAQMHDCLLLEPDEWVVLAFRCGRDLYLLTTKRVFLVDSQGFTGEKCQYLTIPYSSIREFGVKSAGDGWSFDFDCELVLHLRAFWNTHGSPPRDFAINGSVNQDLAKGSCDLLAVHNFLSDRVVFHYGSAAQDVVAGSPPPPLSGFQHGGGTWTSDKPKGILGLIQKGLAILDRDNFRQLDEEELTWLTAKLDTPPGEVLLPSTIEWIEMGFRNRNDLILFTNLRLFVVDFSARSFFRPFGGNKTEYRSMPWGSAARRDANLLAFSLQTENFSNAFDLDSTMVLYKNAKTAWAESVDLFRGESDHRVIAKYLEKKAMIPAGLKQNRDMAKLKMNAQADDQLAGTAERSGKTKSAGSALAAGASSARTAAVTKSKPAAAAGEEDEEKQKTSGPGAELGFAGLAPRKDKVKVTKTQVTGTAKKKKLARQETHITPAGAGGATSTSKGGKDEEDEEEWDEHEQWNEGGEWNDGHEWNEGHEWHGGDGYEKGHKY
eukprot:g3044.t1